MLAVFMGLGVLVTSDSLHHVGTKGPASWCAVYPMQTVWWVSILLWGLNLHCLRLGQFMAGCFQVWACSMVCHTRVTG